MNKNYALISWISVLSIWVLFVSNQRIQAQGLEDEVYLNFRYQAIVNDYISTIYYNDVFFISVGEIFNSLSIENRVDRGQFTISGNYIDRGPYSINFNNQRATFSGRTVDLNADSFVITEFGFYLHPDIFLELFQLEFTIDFNNLAIYLSTTDTMPIVAQRERERRRSRILSTQRNIRRDFYPLQIERNRNVLNGGFIDYNLNANINDDRANSYVYNGNLGMEILSGDLQGTVFGSYSAESTTLRSSGLRWRFGVPDNAFISSISLGQRNSSGFTSAAYTGLRITNEPFEPRFLFGETAFTGGVSPNAEVELYRNNSLIDFTQADASGQYFFSVPITYGTSNYSIRSFSPTGDQTDRNLRLQIPQNYLPKGEIKYVVEAGRLDNPLAGNIERGYMGRSMVEAGLNRYITVGGGAEYFEDFHDELPTFVGRVSARVLTNHLISMEAANEAFYRGSISAVYANSASFNVNYTYYNKMGGLYNPGRNVSAIRTNLFTPFRIGTLPLFLRWSYSNEQREVNTVHRYRVDLNSRLGRANIRIGYRDSQIDKIIPAITSTSRVSMATTYNFGRSREMPGLFRGMFLGTQLSFVPDGQNIEDLEVQLSRNIFRTGRFQFSYGRNFVGNFNLIRFSLSLDFRNFRSNSGVRSTPANNTITQSLRGSIGFDSNHNRIIPYNRQQVGRAGLAVRMFVDNNNNGTYDEGEELIPEGTINVERAGATRFTMGGVNYISNLQAYRRYNVVVNKSSVNNPLLVPTTERFSIITDPNQFKLIEIPFYTSGIIDGMVYQVAEDSKSGLGGVRLYLVQVNVMDGVSPFRQELRTFADGSFYAYEIPPGDYEVRVDQSQQDFLNVKTEPEVLELTVRAVSEGDFVEGLEINLVPKDPFEVMDEAVDDSVEVSEMIPETMDNQQDELVAIAEEESVDETVDESVEEQADSIAELTETEVQDISGETVADDEDLFEESLQSEETIDESAVDSLIAGETPVETENADSLTEESIAEVQTADESIDESVAQLQTEDEPIEEAIAEMQTEDEPIEESIADVQATDEPIEESITEVQMADESVEEPIAESLSDEDSTELASEEELIEQAFANAEFAEEDDPLEIESLDESLIMDPNQERTISDIQIFTQDASCRFSIQMAEYRSLEEAFSGANRFERETGLTFQIYSAGPQSPFTIRTSEKSYFGEVLTTFNELLARNPSQKPAIITQCVENEEARPLRYLIQLAAFSSEENAERFRDELRDRYQLASRLDLSGGSLIRVQAGPYVNRRELLNAFRVLAQDNVSPGMFILVDPSSYYNMSQEFRLQVGLFNNPRDAVRYAFEISEAFNIDTFVIIDGSAVKVMVNKKYDAWDDVFRDFTLISSYENANQPAIHLSEQE